MYLDIAYHRDAGCIKCGAVSASRRSFPKVSHFGLGTDGLETATRRILLEIALYRGGGNMEVCFDFACSSTVGTRGFDELDNFCRLLLNGCPIASHALATGGWST